MFSKITVEIAPSTSIQEAAEEIYDLAEYTESTIEFTFNDIIIIVDGNDTVNSIIDAYYEEFY